MKKLKYISWNVNGLRACLKKGFMDAFNAPVKVGKFAAKSLNTIIVSRREFEIPADAGDEPDMLVVRSFSQQRMSHLRSALLIGLVFGIGIATSGMINPAKVLNYFDIAGTWDPSLAFVMGGALDELLFRKNARCVAASEIA